MRQGLAQKYQALRTLFAQMDRVVVAFSGGVDSTLVLAVAREVLGDRVLAVTVHSCVVPREEREQASALARRLGVSHRVLEMDFFGIPSVAENPENRCYFCKKEILKQLFFEAEKEGFSDVVEGSNLDDLGDYRPGLQALAETPVKSPLREAGFTKEEVRELSRALGLPTWDKPSLACLASRVPYGEPLTAAKLDRVERAERFLRGRGMAQVRVRCHGNVARIEVEEMDFSHFLEPAFRQEVHDALRGLGFAYVSLDLRGYRTGSMNETLNPS